MKNEMGENKMSNVITMDKKEIASPGLAAYQRTRPVLERAVDDVRELVFTISREWVGLSEDEQEVYAKNLGWSVNRCRNIAAVDEEKFLKKQAVIQDCAPDAPALDDLSIESIIEIHRTKKPLLEKAAKEGLFTEKAPSPKAIRRLRSTGTTKKPPVRPVSDLQKQKYKFDKAMRQLKEATSLVSDIHTWMDANDVAEIRGIEVRQFFKAFEKLAAQIAAVDPEKVEEATKILMGAK